VNEFGLFSKRYSLAISAAILETPAHATTKNIFKNSYLSVFSCLYVPKFFPLERSFDLTARGTTVVLYSLAHLKGELRAATLSPKQGSNMRQRKEGQLALFQQPPAPQLLKKAVQAIHASPKKGIITLQQRRIFNALIKNAISQNQADPARTQFEMPVPEIKSMLELSTNNVSYIKDTIRSLIGIVVDWDHLNTDGTKGAWIASGLIAGARIEGSHLHYSFSEEIRSELLDPEKYAMIDLRIAAQFRRSHSLALWENTVRYERVGQTARMPLGKFKDLILGQEEGSTKYKEYKIFKRAVLVPCIAEINELSEHLVELVEFKNGRTVVALQFKVKRKEGAGLELVDADPELLLAITKLGVPLSEARKLAGTFDATRIKSAVAYTKSRQGKKNAPGLDNVAAYFRRSLAGGWGDQADGAPVKLAGRASDAMTADDLRLKYLSAQLADAKRYFAELSDDDQSALIASYNESVTASNLKVKAGKALSKLVESSFFTWLTLQVWGEPSTDDLLAFVLRGKTLGL
jgi:hypothetical protein